MHEQLFRNQLFQDRLVAKNLYFLKTVVVFTVFVKKPPEVWATSEGIISKSWFEV